MATVDFYTAMDMTQLTIWRGYPTNYSNYQISVIDYPYSGTYYGFFKYSLYGAITGGYMTGYDSFLNNTQQFSLSGANAAMVTLVALENKGNSIALEKFVLSGNDTFNAASGGGDTMLGGAGIDTFNIGSGMDTVLDLGDGGSDILNISAGATAIATIYSSGWTATAATVNNGAADLTTAGFLVNVLHASGNSGWEITSTRGTDTLTGGMYADIFNVSGGTSHISNLGYGADILEINPKATAIATIFTNGWTATSSTLNNGTAKLTTDGYDVNLAQAGGSGDWTIINTNGNDLLSGSANADTFIIKAGVSHISDFGYGADVLQVTNGATAAVTLYGPWVSSAATVNNGTVSLTTFGYTLNLAKALGTHGFYVTDTGLGNNFITTQNGTQADQINVLSGHDLISGFNGPDTIVGGATATVMLNVKGRDSYLTNASDNQLINVQYVTATAAATTINLSRQTEGFTIDGSTGMDTIVGGTGSNTFILGAGDSITGGTAIDTFQLATGSSGYTAATAVTIKNFHAGSMGMSTGDVIVDTTAVLKIGGSAAAATSSVAAINQTTGVATFNTTGSIALSTAVKEIAHAFYNSGDENGDFAFFKLSPGGSEYLYISAGNETSPGVHDNLLQLVGVNAIAAISLSGGHLSIIV